MTINKYKVLGAMRALHKKFAIEDLVRYSGLPDSTVRTILARENQFYEVQARGASGRPGGQVLEFRVKPDALPKLEAAISEIYYNYPVPSSTTLPQAPLSLAVAEDILNRKFKRTAPVADQIKCLHLVYLLVGDAREELMNLAREASDQTVFIPFWERLESTSSIFWETLEEAGLSLSSFNPEPSVPGEVLKSTHSLGVG